MSTEWNFAQTEPAQKLAQLHHFSVLNKQGIEFLITIREYGSPKDPKMKFMASADKQTNQKTAPFLPAGFGITLLDALSECIRSVDYFPYEG
jgi:hypothetical protein